jgi:hypothetical protein
LRYNFILQKSVEVRKIIGEIWMVMKGVCVKKMAGKVLSKSLEVTST